MVSARPPVAGTMVMMLGAEEWARLDYECENMYMEGCAVQV